ncbi:MAG: prenyltransferase/squalene oxidase repeat-containing protein [Planctomycetota bacterium]|jgi:hypothetical protein
MSHRTRLAILLPALLLVVLFASAADAEEPAARPDAPAPEAGPRARGLAWLSANQGEDGSWGRRHTVAVTGLACLAHLAARDDPFAGDDGRSLLRGLSWLLAQQEGSEGQFPSQGHTWIHGQGFATLALAEAYGRILLRGLRPDIDVAAIRTAVEKAAARITENQAVSGGWWYTPGDRHNHEGSTTVCAVQALVSAANFGISVDAEALHRGFEYLKRCQNPDGGFDYKEGPGTVSMKEGTAGDISTLALMRRFDYEVMIKGVDFLQNIGAASISKERFPYYGHFYGSMGLRLYGEEMGATEQIEPWIAAATKDVLSWQQEDGSWPLKGWMVSSSGEDGAYGTAFAILILSVPETRLSIFNRRATEFTASREGGDAHED